MNVQLNIPAFQPTAYYPRYGYANKNEVSAKQQALLQETKKKKVRTFTHFNNYLFMLGKQSSPSDASHAGYCKYKHLTVMIIAIISYKCTIQHSPFSSNGLLSALRVYQQ